MWICIRMIYDEFVLFSIVTIFSALSENKNLIILFIFYWYIKPYIRFAIHINVIQKFYGCRENIYELFLVIGYQLIKVCLSECLLYEGKDLLCNIWTPLVLTKAWNLNFDSRELVEERNRKYIFINEFQSFVITWFF